jgi:hypothetical protein
LTIKRILNSFIYNFLKPDYFNTSYPNFHKRVHWFVFLFLFLISSSIWFSSQKSNHGLQKQRNQTRSRKKGKKGVKLTRNSISLSHKKKKKTCVKSDINLLDLSFLDLSLKVSGHPDRAHGAFLSENSRRVEHLAPSFPEMKMRNDACIIYCPTTVEILEVRERERERREGRGFKPPRGANKG